ncbi:helix-turn-helix domain-containing protein [Lentzea terrae]|nr:helix-turn-helix domain-containing protein [Lentzea terrae]
MADKTAIKGKRITGSDRISMGEDLKAKYEKGASIRALAEDTGRSYGFVHGILGESGVVMRSRSGHAVPSSARPNASIARTANRPSRNARTRS